MPLHGIYVVKAGSKARSAFFSLRDRNGVALTGLRAGAEGLTAAYVREGESMARTIALVEGGLGGHVEGGFVEVDGQMLPGVYQLNLPDAVLEQGSVRALVMINAPDAVVAPIEVDLVAYDPQDSR